MHGKTKSAIAMTTKEDGYILWSELFHFLVSFRREFYECSSKSSIVALAVFRPCKCWCFHFHFVVFVMIFCLRLCAGFPHERQEFSSLFVEAVGEIFGACCSFVLLSNRCKTLLREHLFFCFSRIIFFL